LTQATARLEEEQLLIQEETITPSLKVISMDINRVDATCAGMIKERITSLINDGCHTLIVDFKSVEFIDSSGLGTFVSTLKRLGSRDQILLCNLQPNVASTFKLTRMDRVFAIHNSVDEAIKSVKN
jgi:anti-sigma B factor antagonist